MTVTKPVQGALYDSEAALRLVDSALEAMTGEKTPAPDDPAVLRGDLTDPLLIVAQGHEELTRILASVRQSRGALDGAVSGNAKGGKVVRDAIGVLEGVESRLTDLVRVLRPAITELVDPTNARR